MKVRSPLFYVGDKYKLMPQLKQLFPDNINTFVDVFAGGGSASLNTSANQYILNDIDSDVMSLHKFISNNSKDVETFITKFHKEIQDRNLSLSELGIDNEIKELKKIYSKTYFSKYNKNAYAKLRDDYNNEQTNLKLLYLLLVYGFNHMIRFNKRGEFNLPVGNVDWNKNVSQALRYYAEWYNQSKVFFYSKDYIDLINNLKFEENDFLYLDPPYLITYSDYNKLWNKDREKELYKLLTILDKKGIKWGLSNMLQHKEKFNNDLLSFSNKYNSYRVKSNYISRFDNSVKEDSIELFVTNCTNFYQ